MSLASKHGQDRRRSPPALVSYRSKEENSTTTRTMPGGRAMIEFEQALANRPYQVLRIWGPEFGISASRTSQLQRPHFTNNVVAVA